MGKSKKVGPNDFWGKLGGWKPVAVSDDLLLGADEFGFCGLEELDASAVGDLLIPGGAPEVDEAPAATAQPLPAKQKGKKRKGAETAAAEAPQAAAQDVAPAAAEIEGSVDELKGQLAALQAENKQLKKRQKREEKTAAKAKKQAAAVTQRKQDKAAVRAAAADAKAAAAAAAEAAVPLVDTSAWQPLGLHPDIEAAIGRLGFTAPTHVQAECLPAAILDRRDIIGAAQTGSGKTLAFGLPIMQRLMQERQQAQQAQRGAGEAQQQDGEQQQSGQQGESPLRALILAPTRELALQVCEHLRAVGRGCGIWVVPIVGGISALKQERMLGKHPEVVVATPGRLWDLMREGHAHLTNLASLSFLVIDEADRMVQQGHYGELSSILGSIPVHQLLAAPEAAAVPQDEPVAAEDTGGGTAAGGDEDMEGMEGEEGEEEHEEEEEGSEGEDGQGQQEQQQEQEIEQDQDKQQQHPQSRLQTFVFSATLTLPANLRKRLRSGGGGASGSTDLDSLMDKIPFRGKPKIVDLTSKRRLADKVEEAYLACGEDERDKYLYCLLTKHPGRTIVFVNAISSVRRLGAILKLLGLTALPLHAGMQQRQRLRALDRFKADPAAVLVATDVAARGLDIKDVRCVIHYQLPASVDVYVHRSGRTARADAEGVSVALVTPKETARFLALLRAMGRQEPPEFPLDTSLLPAVHRRVRLAVRLDSLERRQSKEKAEKSWRQQHAEQLGIELSESEEEDEDGGSGRRQGRKAKRDRGGKRGPEEEETAAEVRAELAALLAEPLQPKYSQKWFTGGAAAAVMAAVDPSAPAAGGKKAGGKKVKLKNKLGGSGGSSGTTAGEAKSAAKEGGGAGGGKRRREGEEAPLPAAAADPKTQQTVSHAVALAQQRSDSRGAATARAVAERHASDAKRQRQGKKPAAAAATATASATAAAKQGNREPAAKQTKRAAASKQASRKQADPRAAVIQAALNKALAAKQRKKAGPGGRSMLVIPHALGREAAGPDALQALRLKLGGH